MALRNFEWQHILNNQIVHNAFHISQRKFKSKFLIALFHSVLL